MAAALISNKPEFVKLFLEQGVRLKEFVTWDTLLYLYENLVPSSVFHIKLQKVLAEEKEHLACPRAPRVQLHHVSQVLRELLGDSTQMLYPKPKQPERHRLSIPVPHIKLNVRDGPEFHGCGTVRGQGVGAGIAPWIGHEMVTVHPATERLDLGQFSNQAPDEHTGCWPSQAFSWQRSCRLDSLPSPSMEAFENICASLSVAVSLHQ